MCGSFPPGFKEMKKKKVLSQGFGKVWSYELKLEKKTNPKTNKSISKMAKASAGAKNTWEQVGGFIVIYNQQMPS